MAIDSTSRQSILLADSSPPGGARGPHVAIIMDGSGRWAVSRGAARSEGHRAGLAAVRRTVEAAPGIGVGTLTLFAFSSDNWKRPGEEVGALMEIFRQYLLGERDRFVSGGIRAGIVGRRDRLPAPVLAAAREVEETTAGGSVMRLRIALDYSGKDAIARAAGLAASERDAGRACSCGGHPALVEGACTYVGVVDSAEGSSSGVTEGQDSEAFRRRLAAALHEAEPAPPIDLLIRTGGEQRLSDCLLWEVAYAELLFTKILWPDFGPEDLRAALDEFRSRERRFGAAPAPPVRRA